MRSKKCGKVRQETILEENEFICAFKKCIEYIGPDKFCSCDECKRILCQKHYHTHDCPGHPIKNGKVNNKKTLPNKKQKPISYTTRVKNNQQCQHCKEGENLINCDDCERTFHRDCLERFCAKNKLGYEKPPESDSESDDKPHWLCPRCMPIEKVINDNDSKQSKLP